MDGCGWMDVNYDYYENYEFITVFHLLFFEQGYLSNPSCF